MHAIKPSDDHLPHKQKQQHQAPNQTLTLRTISSMQQQQHHAPNQTSTAIFPKQKQQHRPCILRTQNCKKKNIQSSITVTNLDCHLLELHVQERARLGPVLSVVNRLRDRGELHGYVAVLVRGRVLVVFHVERLIAHVRPWFTWSDWRGAGSTDLQIDIYSSLYISGHKYSILLHIVGGGGVYS